MDESLGKFNGAEACLHAKDMVAGAQEVSRVVICMKPYHVTSQESIEEILLCRLNPSLTTPKEENMGKQEG